MEKPYRDNKWQCGMTVWPSSRHDRPVGGETAQLAVEAVRQRADVEGRIRNEESKRTLEEEIRRLAEERKRLAEKRRAYELEVKHCPWHSAPRNCFCGVSVAQEIFSIRIHYTRNICWAPENILVCPNRERRCSRSGSARRPLA